MQLLLLEDDMQLGQALHTALTKIHSAVWVRRIFDAKQQIERAHFDVVLLDIGLPDGSGLELLTWLRNAGKTLPVIMLTAKDAIEDRITGLDAGADDYLPKPFAVPELLSRIRALSRRSAGFAKDTWSIGKLTLEPHKQRVILDSAIVDLSAREYSLLYELAKKTGQFVTRAHLEKVIFKDDLSVESNALEVHIHNLRKKIGGQRIRTIRGVGYLLEEQDSHEVPA